jgi:type I restriction enzyme S subunit
MKVVRLLAHYERIADAPHAIVRLRRFILDLAVRGKLVPQDASDEPASELLKRIAKEKLALVKAAEIGRGKPLSPLAYGKTSFELPNGWVWVCLGDLSQIVTSGSRDWAKHYSKDGAIFVRMGNLSKDHYRLRLDHIQRVRPPAGGEGTRTRLEAGDILISITRDVGMLGLIPENFGEAYINQHTAMVRPMPEMKGRYLAELFRSPFAQDQFNEPQRGIKNSFRLTDVTQFVVTLPPLAEQHRIVAKVDELMALCDRLEGSRAVREGSRDRLTAASLARLDAPDPETFQADARFALDALPAFTTRPDQIRQLRQTILNLAVRGKLVSQDPNDESASELLSRLHRERKHERKFAQIDEGELDGPLPELPSNWLWTTTDEISADDDNAITDGPFGSQLKTDHYIQASGFRVIRLQNIGSGAFCEEHHSYINESRFFRLSKHHVLAGDLVVAGLVDPRVRCCEVPADIGPALVKADCYRFAVHPRLSSRFALHFLNSPLAQEFAAVHHHGMTLTRIGLGNFRRIPVPLPPIAEQGRIVAKVDALIALCDRLEASLDLTTATRRRLLDVLLAEALAPVDAREP